MGAAVTTIRVSEATYQAIADLAGFAFRSTGTREDDGNWLVPISDELWDRLQQARLPGESDDDTLMRLIRSSRGDKPS